MILASSNNSNPAGDLRIDTPNLTIEEGAKISVEAAGSGNGGIIDINAMEVNVNNSGILASTNSGIGDSINFNNLEILRVNNSQINISTNSGNSGNVNINDNQPAANLIQINNSNFSAQAEVGGEAGSVIVNTQQLNLNDKATITASNVDGKDGGDVNLQNIETLNVLNGSIISATTEIGKAGSLIINENQTPANLVQISGINSNLAAQAENVGGNAGSVIINTQQLNLDDKATITASNVDGLNGGDINLQNIEALKVSGGGQIDATTQDGKAGSLSINQEQQAANRLDLDSGNLTVAASGSGDSGSLEINAKEVNLDNNSEISASTNSGTGGNIELFGLETLDINNSNVTASTQTGQAGDVNIEASRLVNVNGQNSELAARANQLEGIAGNVNIDTRELNVKNGASISASNINDPTGGDVNLQNIETLKASGGGQIDATTEDGRAGSLRINQGQQAANRLDLDSGNLTVEATGSGDSGSLEINAKEVNLDNESNISASTISGTGGNIELFGLEILDVNNSNVTASTQAGQAGDLNIEASRQVNVSGQNSLLAAQANQKQGVAGNVNIDTRELNVENGASISASNINDPTGGDVNLQNIETLKVSSGGQIDATTRDGKAGSLRINQGQEATNQIDLDSGNLTVEATGSGDSGSVEINATEVNLNNSSSISASTNSGTGGNIELFGLETLDVNNSNVTASTETGQAGDLNIDASSSVNVNRQNSELAARANQRNAIAGNVNIDTRELNVENDASISASNIDDPTGGDINLRNIETLKVSSGGEINTTTIDGKAGSLQINQGQQATNRIDLDSGNLTVAASGIGDSGSLEINAKEVNLDNNSRVSASTISGAGGNIEFFGLEVLDVNNSDVTASTQTGQAGDLNIEASRLVQVSDKSSLSVEATKGGNAGTLSIKSPITNVYDGAEVTVSSPNGQAGNLNN